MLPIFASAREAEFREFSDRLRSKLSDKFDFVVGKTKLLHALAELNGFRNWQSMKAACVNESTKNEWLISQRTVGDWPETHIAPNLDSAINAFLFCAEQLIRLFRERAGWEILGQERDSASRGLFLLFEKRIMLSMTSAAHYTGLYSTVVESAKVDFSQLAGICSSLLQDVGLENDAASLQEKAMNTLPAHVLEVDIEQVVGNFASRDIVCDQNLLTAIEALRGKNQTLAFTAVIQGGV